MPNGDTQTPQFDGQNPVTGYTLIHRKDGSSLYLKGENLSSDDVAQRLGAAPSQSQPTMAPGSYQARKSGPILNANDSTLHSGIQGVQNALGVTKPPKSLWDEFSQIGGSLKNFAGKSWDELQQATGEEKGIPVVGTPFTDALIVPHMIARGVEGLATGVENSASDIEAGIKNKNPQSAAYGIGSALGMRGQLEAGERTGEAINEVVPGVKNVLKQSAAKNYQDVLNPTRIDTKYQTQKIMPQLVKEAPVAMTRQGLAEKAAGQADIAGQQIEQTVSGLQGSMKTQPVIDGLENLRQKYQVNGVSLRPEVDGAINALQDQLRGISQPADVPGGAAGPGEASISYQDVVKARRILDQAVAEVGGYQGRPLSDTSMANIRKATANSFREELGNASPDLAAVNAKFHFWNTLNEVLEQTIQRKTGQVNALPKMETVIAGAGGLASGGGLTAALGFGAAMKALGSAFRSTGWRTVSAATKSSIADSLANGQFKNVLDTLGKAGIVAAGANQEQKQDETPTPQVPIASLLDRFLPPASENSRIQKLLAADRQQKYFRGRKA
jgi:hypothetical protein